MIKKIRQTVSFLVFALAANSSWGQSKPRTVADLVNVFTGTSNSRWQMFPGATLPFGMVKLSPDNQGNVWNGGYEYTIGSISGFSHLHAMSLSGLSIMPTTGSAFANEGWIKGFPGAVDGPFGGMWTAGYRSRYKKESEHGSPGYYSVELLDYQIKAELTSTLRCGMMRLTYPQSTASHLIIDLDPPAEEKNEVVETHFEKLSPTRFRGYIRQKNTYVPEYTVCFVLELSKPVTSFDAWQTQSGLPESDSYGTVWRKKRSVEKNADHFDGQAGSGIVLNFSSRAGEQIKVRTGISFVSMEAAAANLEAELPAGYFDFDGIVSRSRKIWEKLLGAVEVSGASQDDRSKFYTNLYRCYTGKSIMNDVNGNYRDACRKIQTLQKPADAVYSSDALWGTQWDLTPVWTLISPSIARSWVNALLELDRCGGWIPSAPDALAYSPIMGAQHQNSLIISSWQKGIRGFDGERAYRAILHDYTTPGIAYPCGGFAGDRHLQSYMDHGFVSEEAGPASNTLEYAYDDWAFSQFCKSLGKKDDYKKFGKRSMNYRNIFDSTSHFARQRFANGTWKSPFDPFKFGTVGGWNGKGFVEGTPYQYSFFVPQDVPGLVKLMGRDTFLNRLERGFEEHLFDLGNQPCLQTPFLFNYAGRPWLTQHYTRQIARDFFNTSPYGGWVGEEDEGQMGAYYVLLSLGLFEVDGGCAVKPWYNLTSPVFSKIIVHLDPDYYSGKTFTIISSGNSPENDYIQSATLNGKPMDRPWIYHSEIVSGARLNLQLGPKPNKKWGTKNSLPVDEN